MDSRAVELTQASCRLRPPRQPRGPLTKNYASFISLMGLAGKETAHRERCRQVFWVEHTYFISRNDQGSVCRCNEFTRTNVRVSGASVWRSCSPAPSRFLIPGQEKPPAVSCRGFLRDTQL